MPGWVTTWVDEMERRGILLQGSTELRPVSYATDGAGPQQRSAGHRRTFRGDQEQIGGFDIMECTDLNEAIEVVTKHPGRPVQLARGAAVLGVLTCA